MARCGCTAGACGCVIIADNNTTTCIDIAVSADPGSADFPIRISATPVIDPTAGNLLSCEATGLRADLTVTDSVCIDFTGNGSPASPLSATLRFDPDVDDCINCGPQGIQLVIDPDVTNALVCTVDGLFVPPAGADTHDGAGAGSTYALLSADSPTSAGLDSVAIGKLASSSADEAVALGAFTTASAAGAVAIGEGATSSGSEAVAVGDNSEATGGNSVSLGYSAISNADTSLALGVNSFVDATGVDGIAIGTAAFVEEPRAIAIGANASAVEDDSLALGAGATAGDIRAISIGGNSDSYVESIAIGYGANANSNSNAIAIGSGEDPAAASRATGIAAIAIGSNDTISVQGALASGLRSVAIGGGSGGTLQGAISSGNDSISIGSEAEASGNNTVALGAGSTAGNDSSVAIGAGASTTAVNQIRLGTATEDVNIPGTLTLSGGAVTPAAWSTFTPTWSGTLGDGTIAGRYSRVGKTIHYYIALTWGSTTSHAAAAQVFGLPFTPAQTTGYAAIGVSTLEQTGVSLFTRTALWNTDLSGVTINLDNIAITNTAPFTWANTHKAWIRGTYEAA